MSNPHSAIDIAASVAFLLKSERVVEYIVTGSGVAVIKCLLY